MVSGYWKDPIVLQKVRKQGIRFWHKWTLKILARKSFSHYGMFDLLPESLVFTCAKILSLVSLLFEESWQNFIPSFLIL